MMRIVRLMSLATRAEGLRLRRLARQVAARAVLAAIAAGLGIAALVLLHVAAVAWLEPREGLPAAAAIVAGVDLVLAAIFLLLAARRLRDPVAAEVVDLRNRVGAELSASAGRTALVGEVLLHLIRYLRSRRG